MKRELQNKLILGVCYTLSAILIIIALLWILAPSQNDTHECGGWGSDDRLKEVNGKFVCYNPWDSTPIYSCAFENPDGSCAKVIVTEWRDNYFPAKEKKI